MASTVHRRADTGFFPHCRAPSPQRAGVAGLPQRRARVCAPLPRVSVGIPLLQGAEKKPTVPHGTLHQGNGPANPVDNGHGVQQSPHERRRSVNESRVCAAPRMGFRDAGVFKRSWAPRRRRARMTEPSCWSGTIRCWVSGVNGTPAAQARTRTIPSAAVALMAQVRDFSRMAHGRHRPC